MIRVLTFSFIILFSASSVALSPRTQLRRAINLIEKGDYVLGSRELYRLSRLKAFKNKRIQIKYTLGITFIEMKLYHLASFQLIYVIKKSNGSYRKKALEKIASIIDYLGDEDLLYYIVSQIKEREFPIVQRDKLYFYSGVASYNKSNYKKARYYFSRIKRGSKFYSRSIYYRALTYAEENKVKRSAQLFRDLIGLHPSITDSNHAAGYMGLARVLYQGKKFNQSIAAYRSVPKDSKHFHDALLENSWNFLRSGKFRSALSNFQTLHSKFYQDFYQPESLVLRAYVYLYICKYYEMEKVLDLFNTLYGPVKKDVNQALRWRNLYTSYFNAVTESKKLKNEGVESVARYSISPILLNRIMKNPKFKIYSQYLDKIKQEKIVMENLPESWKRDRVGRNASYILNSRITTSQKLAGKLIKSILLSARKDLKNLSTSAEYLRYDMLRGKRESIKKRIANRYADVKQIDSKISRNYYIQNGYEYWPFHGEYWLDEIGNYHYLGRHNCAE